MAIDWTVKVTDAAIVIASFTGPFCAVWAAEWLRKKSDKNARRVHIFRTLMATRSQPASQLHVEAINLVEIEFSNDKGVIDAWALYRHHLDSGNRYSTYQDWDTERERLHHELLFAISGVLKYPFAKSDMKRGTYYPISLSEEANDTAATRKLWLEILKGNRPLPTSQFAPPPAAAEGSPNQATKR